MTTPNITKAVELLKAGGLVAFPTETVYGLGADARNEEACRRIFKVKERPYDHPLIVHIASMHELSDWARDISPAAMQLAQAFWPGPLTLILKKREHVLDIISGHQETIGLRIPNHPVAQQLLQSFGSGIAAPSANKFTHISPTRADAVFAELGTEVDLILDGGACTVGLESTIIDMSQEVPVILRPGMISAPMLSNILHQHILFSRQDAPNTRAPGMHHLHYAPITQTQLVESKNILSVLHSLKSDDLPIALMVHSKIEIPKNDAIHCVPMPDHPKEYAHDLYHVLRLLDNLHFKRILIEAVPEHSEWQAIQDRILKATAMR